MSATLKGSATPIPAIAGIGLRDRHFAEIDAERPAIGWIEVHSENFFGDDPRRRDLLTRLRADYPLSLHGVGLSLGSVQPPDAQHLAQLCRLVERHEPWMVSEHCCWGAAGGLHSNNLLPLPRTREALDILCAHVGQVQDLLGRAIALENISTYLDFEHAEFTEPEFLGELVQRSGCHLLLDINNLYVNSVNHEFDPLAYLAGIPAAAVVEYHLAGYEDRGHTLIDTHGAPVSEPAWALCLRLLMFKQVAIRSLLRRRVLLGPGVLHMLRGRLRLGGLHVAGRGGRRLGGRSSLGGRRRHRCRLDGRRVSGAGQTGGEEAGRQGEGGEELVHRNLRGGST